MSMLLMVKAMNMKVGNPLRKLVLIKLADNANDCGECWPSHQHIADQCEISRRSVISHIEALCDAGLLRKEARAANGVKRSNLYILSLDSAAVAHSDVQEIHPICAGAAQEGSAGDAHRTSHSLEPVIEPVKEQEILSDSRSSSDVKLVFEHWQRVMGKQRTQLDNNRRGLIERALKKYSIEDLKAAIDGCAASSFHMGQNRDGKKYNGLDLILRNSEKIEGFRDSGAGSAKRDAHSGFKPGDYDHDAFCSEGAKAIFGDIYERQGPAASAGDAQVDHNPA